jgi:hypothetical protein
MLSPGPIRGAQASDWFGRWFDALPGDAELLSSPEFRDRYFITSRATVPGQWLTVFVRRDGPPLRP